MTHKTAPDVPDGMQKIYRRFERWRSSHQGRLPIPKALWASAAEAAREHGVFRTATILRLEYAKLKRMTKSTAPVKRRLAPGADFLELVATHERLVHDFFWILPILLSSLPSREGSLNFSASVLLPPFTR